MLVGIIGDTHGDVHSIRQAVALTEPVDLWLHTGDFCRDARSLTALTGIPVISVAGNCDGRGEAKPDEFIELAGYRIWLTHGHHFGVKQNLYELRDWASQYESDIVVYGHTHQPAIITESTLLLFNPGSAAMPRRGKSRTFGVIELKDGREGILPRLITIT